MLGSEIKLLIVDFDGTLSETKNAAVCVDVDAERFRRRYVKRVADTECK